ncbi:hypothetical protein NEAUS06_1289 [Nematocida ausubeli]|nr:hypothetical protein NEAUS06_1289 [Nematocida ausubeli]
MKRDHLQYITQNMAINIFAVALRCYCPSESLSRYSYYDLTEAEEYIKGNPFADKPAITLYYFTKMLSLISIGGRYSVHSVLFTVTALCDFMSAYLLGTPMYFLLTSFLPSEVYSIICLVAVLCYRKILLRYTAPLLALLCIEGTYTKCAPGINPYWYINMQMFEEYRELCRDIFQAMHFFFQALTIYSQCISTKLYLTMVFKDLGYRGYILVWCILSIQKTERKQIFNLLLGLSFLGAVIDHLVWYMLVLCGVGNMNFLCWSNAVTIVSTGVAALLHEKSVRNREKRT